MLLIHRNDYIHTVIHLPECGFAEEDDDILLLIVLLLTLDAAHQAHVPAGMHTERYCYSKTLKRLELQLSSFISTVMPGWESRVFLQNSGSVLIVLMF